jgi:hypothetical protein
MWSHWKLTATYLGSGLRPTRERKRSHVAKPGYNTAKGISSGSNSEDEYKGASKLGRRWVRGASVREATADKTVA